ncbi:hypothetical protein [Nocardia terpenica]|uniref:Uncharacterized protein n=1 Tax=Nocardia terpenica TaxID=455432 RepID=A0A291RQ44_9NOCA|nr:hypothetical protein [Nocardia terpenica]ATL69676.1 hypothetical protein CRH09_29405 [Nocardia terpenica]
MRTLVTRSILAATAVTGVVFALGAGNAAADPAATAAFSPTFTIGTKVGGSEVTCAGYLESTAAVYPGQTPGPVEVLLKSHFVGISPQCLISGTVKWTNQDTGASGSKRYDLSGFDGPAAPTGVYFDPGFGHVTIEIDSDKWCIPGKAELTV